MATKNKNLANVQYGFDIDEPTNYFIEAYHFREGSNYCRYNALRCSALREHSEANPTQTSVWIGKEDEDALMLLQKNQWSRVAIGYGTNQ